MTIAQHLRRRRILGLIPIAALVVFVSIRVTSRLLGPSQLTDFLDLANMASYTVVLVACLVIGARDLRDPAATELVLGEADGSPAMIAPRGRTYATGALAIPLGPLATAWLDEDWSLPTLRWILTVIVAAVVALNLLAGLIGRNPIALTAQGVELPGGFGSRFVPWVALSPAGPQPGPATEPLTLRVADPTMIRTRGLVRSKPDTIRVRSEIVHAGFLAHVIGHYTGRPERRSAIGTPGEYARLRAQLGLSS